ncbi:hypothetical protein Mapa_005781 [Marchantia paleacea]|nr:hypothetical protein Mapa_005781 [Marchantia paleacea]
MQSITFGQPQITDLGRFFVYTTQQELERKLLLPKAEEAAESKSPTDRIGLFNRK